MKDVPVVELPTEIGFYQFERDGEGIYCYAYNGKDWLFIDLIRPGHVDIYTKSVSASQMTVLMQSRPLTPLVKLNEWGMPDVN